MELTKKEQKFSKALEVIEDLYALGDADLYPVFDRLFYQVGELSRISDESLNDALPKFNNVHNLFEIHVQRLVKIYFDSLPVGCQVSFTSCLAKASMARVDFICELLPQIFNCGSIFNFQESLAIDLREDEIFFKAKVELPVDLENLRMDCYRLSRTFLDYGVLFTFQSLEADGNSQYDIEFKFSLPEESSRVFGLELSESRWISFPSLIGKFEVDPTELKSIGNHKIFTIDENYQLKATSLCDAEQFIKKERVTALHFPFLFRPISLIISAKSFMVEKAKLFRLSSTGCDKGLEFNNMPSWQHIDLLELMKN